MTYITTKTIFPGQKGAINETQIYGDRLVCVRYKFDNELCQNIKTVELITDIRKIEKSEKIPFNKKVYVRINRHERHLQRIVKSVGARWTPDKLCWQMSYGDVFNLGLEARIAD